MDAVAVYVDSSGSTYDKIEERAEAIRTLRLFGASDMFSFGCHVHEDVNTFDGGGAFLEKIIEHRDVRYGSRAPILVVMDDHLSKDYLLKGSPSPPGVHVITFEKVKQLANRLGP